MQIIDKIALIVTNNGKVLSTKSKGKSKYYLPGGKREKGETDEDTLVREILEELSVHIKTNTITYIGTFSAQADAAADGVIVKMTCYTAIYEGELAAANEIEEVVWLNYKDLNKVSAVDKIIFKFLKDNRQLY